MADVRSIIGSNQLVARFGHWPSFHDAEVICLTLDRRGDNGPTMTFAVHTWEMTANIDDRGHYILEKHTLVQFLFERMTSCELAGFNDQNVLWGLSVEPELVDGVAQVRVLFHSSYGLCGSLTCARATVAKVTPCDATGRPTQSA